MSLDDHLIDRKQSNILKNEYVASNYRSINSSRPADKPDSRMYTFDLEIMQEYLDLIRKEMEKRGIKNKGIRITMGKYPEEDFSGMKPKYAGYQTVVISAADLDASVGKMAAADNSDSSNETSTMDIPEMNFASITPPYN